MVFLSLSFLRQISENCNPPLQLVLPHHPLTIVTPYNLGFLTDHSPKISLFITKSNDKFLVLTSLDLLFNLVIIQLYLLSQKHSIEFTWALLWQPYAAVFCFFFRIYRHTILQNVMFYLALKTTWSCTVLYSLQSAFTSIISFVHQNAAQRRAGLDLLSSLKNEEAEAQKLNDMLKVEYLSGRN